MSRTSQDPIAAPRKIKVVSDNEGGKPVLVMQPLHQIEDHFRGPSVQVTWLFVLS